jgi:hypothetical protein
MKNKTNKTSKKVQLPEVVLTPVQKLEKVLVENNIAIGVRAVHDQEWRARVLEFVSRLLKVKVVPFIYSTKKDK